MSEQRIMAIVDEALLKGLDSKFQPEGEKVEVCIWVSYWDKLPFEVLKKMLLDPWDQIRPVNGICTKVYPLYLTSEEADWIKANMETIPMDSREILENIPMIGFNNNMEEFLEWKKLQIEEEINKDKIDIGTIKPQEQEIPYEDRNEVSK
jgi:hypothetical protein